MKRFIDMATALVVGAALFTFIPDEERHFDIVSFQIQPITPKGQSMKLGPDCPTSPS